MSRFQKIFLASALVVVGFCVAKFLGQPIVPGLALPSHSASPAVVQVTPMGVAAVPASNHVRLLPDSPEARSNAPAASSEVATPQPAHLGNTLAPILAVNNKQDTTIVPRPLDFAPISSAPISQSESPRARLRNEAPRPVGVDPQSPAAIRRVPAENVQIADPNNASVANAAPPAWTAPQLLNAGYSESVPSPPAALPASYAAPVNSAPQSQFPNQSAPPPWPMRDESAEPRTHIVVDGDSLERLANRYLSDPRRGREIYELNREVLSAPDLLPIGAELKIPERVATTSWDRRGFQPNSASVTPNSGVGRENITPDRSTSAPQGIIPRAQLAAPLMVQ